ncbi:Pimeloyl-ACP methyl ester carboxylesterase [Chitinophaga filiformis]|uniref:Pimeloyl-ACP methyl ester carboxylesterase n=2 Tax=Chitinophaga filiformis TaxID=104663 RepID=A0A1G8C7I5_CHIFI|nr:Pimeloyl-ACP methyl ester carboxylesterase [Chitinophaga filiformis]
MKLKSVVVPVIASLIAPSASIAGTTELHSREEYVEVEKNVRLHVTDLGEGQPVVLIHGLPQSDAMYEYQYQYLVENGCRVIGITLRGFGKSDKPYGPYNYDVYAHDIKVVLDKLNIQQGVLGGFSMGGAISIHYIAKYNSAHIAKLALFGAAAPIWTSRPDYPYNLTAESVNDLIALSKANRPQLLENVGKIFAASETALPTGLANWLIALHMEASPYATTQSLIALRDTDLRPELSKINIPTIIFHGTKDKICEFAMAEQMHKGIKNSTIIRFENSGHGLFLEEREKFNSELVKFIQQKV